MKLQEVLNQPDGFTPPDVSVQISKVHDRKSGEGEHGEWSFQNIDVSENGTRAQLKLKNLSEFPVEREGQSVTIRAHHSDKFGLTGLKTETREYQGKNYQNLVVTGSAKWDWNGGTPVEAPASTPAAPAPQPVRELRVEPIASVEASTPYRDHIQACAELAEMVTSQLVLGDAAAIQACFATIVIDTKNRNIFLPAPSVKDNGQIKTPEDVELEEEIPF